jgi:hypothetical protein
VPQVFDILYIYFMPIERVGCGPTPLRSFQRSRIPSSCRSSLRMTLDKLAVIIPAIMMPAATRLDLLSLLHNGSEPRELLANFRKRNYQAVHASFPISLK